MRREKRVKVNQQGPGSRSRSSLAALVQISTQTWTACGYEFGNGGLDLGNLFMGYGKNMGNEKRKIKTKIKIEIEMWIVTI